MNLDFNGMYSVFSLCPIISHGQNSLSTLKLNLAYVLFSVYSVYFTNTTLWNMQPVPWPSYNLLSNLYDFVFM